MSKIFILIFSIFIILFNQIIRLSANDNTYINSSNITYNESENIVELAENSKINFKNTNILIDKGIIDYNTNEFEVFGNFYLYEELTILSGQNLKGNTSLDVFNADNVSYIYNDDLKIDSIKLNRDKNLIYFHDNFLTPCDLDGFFNCPTWSLRIDKTKYDVEEDKFTHFDTFLQIADYKVFYLPYFTHYGAKAPRKKGFLTPTIEFTVGSDQGIITPYYLPVSKSTDILFTPKLILSKEFELTENYQLNTLINNKNSGGSTSISINNIKNKESNNLNSSFKINTKQIINQNDIVSASGLFTNSISTSRSINEDSITFEDIYLRLENYNFFILNDYLKTEISSVESFESIDLNYIPISPRINYLNSINFNNFAMLNEMDFTILKREESSITNPIESYKISLNNDLINNFNNNNLSVYNKILFSNSYSDYNFNDNKILDHNSFKSIVNISSDFNFLNHDLMTPRIKFIIPVQLQNNNKNINEDSESITFNYQNQFAENRFFGNDLFDTSPRIVYGLENNLKVSEKEINYKINQSFETNENSTYSNKINQISKFSDYAIEANLNLNDIFFKIDARLDQNNFSKKEMNYSVNFSDKIDFSLNYNETKANAFKSLSSDTKYINIGISKKINNNLNLSYGTNLDIKNSYEPYSSNLGISLFDECSQLNINYKNTRFSDNFNTHPEEVISITFSMDYLGFFGYQQTTDLFFSEPGNINYGL